MLERLNEEVTRRTHVVRIFPNSESCLRLVRALAAETHENWLEQHRYSIWIICASTRRRYCDVPPDPRAVQPSTVLCHRQVGTKGWSFAIEQRDAAFDLNPTSPRPMTDLLNLTHTTPAF